MGSGAKVFQRQVKRTFKRIELVVVVELTSLLLPSSFSSVFGIERPMTRRCVLLSRQFDFAQNTGDL